ncbi:MAG TPA: pantothenate kinase [Prevotellaceae bacterium]|nr:pantothenate kinase [Prevotellaceae bacterium]
MKLIVDIGNSAAKLVAFDGNEPIEQIKTPGNTLEGIDNFTRKYHFTRGIVGSVTDITPEAGAALDALDFPMMRLTADTPVPITNHYRTPRTLGADRVAAVVGARELKPDENLLIIDAGTCITYEMVDRHGNYWGGNIAPGMQMRLHALHEFTARLPLVDADGEVPGMGYDTETAIRAGVLRGMKYEIEGYIKSLRAKYPSLQVFLTGGDRINFDEGIKSITLSDKYIVPRGLNKILDYNYDKK